MRHRRVKGSYDLTPNPQEYWKDGSFWQFIEKEARTLSWLYGFQEIRTPVFEHTDLFSQSVGEQTDILSKEMYTFLDKAQRSLSLRPEMTTPIIRAYIENRLDQKKGERFFYFAPCFRYNRAQKGRYREFYQFGIEIFSEKDPYLDAEGIELLITFYQNLHIENIHLKVNCLGDKQTRTFYEKALKAYLSPFSKELSPESQKRFEKNPLRILDSKELIDQQILKEAPEISQFLQEDQANYFSSVLSWLEVFKIPYTIDPKLVRGLSYYTDTVFEIISEGDRSSQNTLGAGGRYDGLMENLGGKNLSGFGFATGIERVLQNMPQKNLLEKQKTLFFYIIPLSQEAKRECVLALHTIRKQKKSALMHTNYHLKKGLQTAFFLQAQFVLLLGEKELSQKTVTIKNLTTKKEKQVPMSSLQAIGTLDV